MKSRRFYLEQISSRFIIYFEIDDSLFFQAKKFVESVPKVIREAVPKEEAEKMKQTLEGLGAKVVLE